MTRIHQEADEHVYPLNSSSSGSTSAPYHPAHAHQIHQPQPTASQQTQQTQPQTGEINMVIVGILVGLIVILTLILIFLLIRPVMDFIKSRLPENQKRKELRYQTVEGWVISKRLRKHDELCQKALEAFAAPSSSCIDDDDDVEKGTTTTKKIQNTSSYDTAETEQSWELEWKECPICMEEFKADEIVSWSPDDQTSCLHFFHHECIKEWLLRSPHCPYCRGTIIPVDNTAPGTKVDKLTLVEMSKRRYRKARTTFCCEEHGLVKLNRPKKINRRDKALLDAVLAPGIVETDLVAKRGGRQESSDGDDDNAGLVTNTTAGGGYNSIIDHHHDSLEDDVISAAVATAASEDDSEISSYRMNRITTASSSSSTTTALHSEDALLTNHDSFIIPTATTTKRTVPETEMIEVIHQGNRDTDVIVEHVNSSVDVDEDTMATTCTSFLSSSDNTNHDV